MPTLLEISNNLARTYVESSNKRSAIKRIAQHINCLQFVTNQRLIDYDLKITIVQVMGEFISGERPIQSSQQAVLPVKPRDATSFAKLRPRLLELIWNKREIDNNVHEIDKKQPVFLHTFTLGVRNVTYAAYAELEKYFKIKK